LLWYLTRFSRVVMAAQDIRKLVVDMIMATDMVKHTRILGEMKSFVEKIAAGVRRIVLMR
jgi:hypothetical protein